MNDNSNVKNDDGISISTIGSSVIETDEDDSCIVQALGQQVPTIDHSLALEMGNSLQPQFGSIQVQGSKHIFVGNTYNGPVTYIQNISNEKVSKNKTIKAKKLKAIEAGEKSFSNKFQIALFLSLSVFLIITFGVIVYFVLLKNSSLKQDETDKGKFKIVLRTNWSEKPFPTNLSPLELPVSIIILDHTLGNSCFNSSDCVSKIRSIQSYHKDSRKFSEIAYNFLIGEDAQIYEGRGWDFQGEQHSKGIKEDSIGVAFLGDFAQHIPNNMSISALDELIKEGIRLKKIKENYELCGESQIGGSNGPGEKFYEFIRSGGKWPTCNL